jgi:hypothetical protein
MAKMTVLSLFLLKTLSNSSKKASLLLIEQSSFIVGVLFQSSRNH